MGEEETGLILIYDLTRPRHRDLNLPRVENIGKITKNKLFIDITGSVEQNLLPGWTVIE
jgi:hypothetical protein